VPASELDGWMVGLASCLGEVMTFDYRLVPELKKGGRYFVKSGATTKFNRGFPHKKALDEWFLMLQVVGQLDWRAGSVFRIRGVPSDLVIVNRMGEVA